MDKMLDNFKNKEVSNKSHWALVLIIITIILFSLFWIYRYSKEKYTIVPVNHSIQKEITAESMTSNLEASAEAIYIGNYSDSL